MHEREVRPPQRSWTTKFGDAFRGLKQGVRGQSSFFVHFFTAAAVIAAGIVLGVGRTQWCVLLLCIAAVLAAEMFNSALEAIARAVTDEPNPEVGNALDIGSAAVLIASIGSAIVGTIIFVNRFGILLSWWPDAV